MMALLVLLVQIVTTLGLHQKLGVEQPQASWRIVEQSWSGFKDNDNEDDPTDVKQMDPNDYYDDFYNMTEWEESAPIISPQIADSLMVGTNWSNNLCLYGHFVPEVMVIGGIKASTTSLCTSLRRSPAILWPRRQHKWVNNTIHHGAWKEGHYFDKHFEEGINYMTTDFPKCNMSVRRVAVDGSARYSTARDVPSHISSWYGKHSKQIKFVFLVREPLARLHSHYYHSRRDHWCRSHSIYSFAQIIRGILRGNPKIQQYLQYYEKPDNDWAPPEPPPQFSLGCGDFVEGSLYSHHLRNYFKYFQPSQFILVPFLFNADPGKAGRPPGLVAEFLWSYLGVSGIKGDQTHSNEGTHPSLEQDLTASEIDAMRAWFYKVTGPRVIANIVRSTKIMLYQYTEDPDDAEQIMKWLTDNW